MCDIPTTIYSLEVSAMENVMRELMRRVYQLTQAQAEKVVEAIDAIIEQDDIGDDKVETCPRCG